MKFELSFPASAKYPRPTNALLRLIKKLQPLCFFLFSILITYAIAFPNQISFADYLKAPTSTSIPSYSAFLTDNLEDKKPKKEFSCMNRVYLYFSWLNITGTHEITAFWINPKGKQQNQINLKFIADKPKVENWVALEFNNLFTERYPLVPDISAAKFVGKWQVKILLDGNLLETKSFQVNCG
jgi:hypothetical protein